ncbi:MAG TPA: glycosyltransferase family 39 protein [Isosphaeraceae bacterium]|nr:glycosyltransferase family 39 protein [Isosphaeraceae bacterium]
MSAREFRHDPGLRREILVVGAFTLAGVALRFWSFGRLGLIQFDEGVYALAGLWIFSPQGVAGLDPTLIAYAPPGFPVLVGLAYGCLGVGDRSAILASILAGTLTIPAAGWLASRTFGRGAGAAAAALAALSGPHLAFSRMALTDASFLLCWIIALAQGQRFLERPNAVQAVLLGLSVGIAQLFKYNGWLAGILVVLTAAVSMTLPGCQRSPRRLLATWGWGLLAALVAALAYWPWYRFVDSHGGYAALIAHQRGYLGGPQRWPAYLGVQLAQARALSGGPAWQLLAGLAAAGGMWVARGGWPGWRALPRILLLTGFLATLNAAGFLGLVFATTAAWSLTVSSPGRADARTLVLVGWISLVLLTPCYHPYARLWLPIEALGWILMGGGSVAIGSRWGPSGASGSAQARHGPPPDPIVALGAICVLAVVLRTGPANASHEGRIGTLLQPTDSLRRACRAIAAELPKGLRHLRVYARPAVTFYLAGRVAALPEADLHGLSGAESGSWALLDSALVWRPGEGPEGLAGIDQRWRVVRSVPTELSLPTRLDIDPSAAWSGPSATSAPLLLIQRIPPGDEP